MHANAPNQDDAGDKRNHRDPETVHGMTNHVPLEVEFILRGQLSPFQERERALPDCTKFISKIIFKWKSRKHELRNGTHCIEIKFCFSYLE